MGVRAAAAAVALVAVMGMLAPRAAAQTPNCAAKLVPCSSYMNTTGTPPDTCCGPLKDAVKNDLKCLCDLYATPEIFKAFNISLDEALGLSKRCGLSDTTAACKGSPSGGGSGSNSGHHTLSVGFSGFMSFLSLALWSVLA
ncbi:hypothetical protein Zm00014a_040084 [Zea mays]|uniref:Bifunctional inhibitor/lipid-transfer protein/seed storage 2S albumin superfamily protein n=2 Tax=Zea mays TaxID=4577 RepID=B6UB28_MAIZE|nr:Lipid transfer-like protein VAS precursor 2 precursor [Zea mays]ACG46561.1 lipid binding protein [Zea mays]AQK66449.1 Bifunctional inhibitor/lipid-transfer protein/seed storage 2S albumin superfamily protein [Zea mays]PWZ22717.1 hypothetical protein Zm00014a_040084 [Zea mays]|eukprot:XP_008681138.1 uncharacterized protein LOC100193410 isoform X1 [Zea mays]